MPPNRRRQRQQQHRGQRARRQRGYVSGGQGQAYKPGFPMNLFTGRAALATFAAVGVVLMVAGISLAAFLPDGGQDADIDELPTVPAAEDAAAAEPTEPDPDATPEIVRNFEFAEFVIAPEAELYTATISTSKGDIVIELFADIAPNTVNSFVFLAEKRYFDGLVFHRVVENFVVQGGDPRHDSEGGPGYTLRDELNDLPYLRGTVGMALDWRDTGGSQFFITHSPQPHLDGRYTAFGRVVAGMEVVDAMLPGDRIRRILVWDGRQPPGQRPAGGV